MTEYIDQADAIEAVNHAWAKGLEPTQFLENVPAADVAPVRHGKWTPVKYNAHCSCGKSYGIYHFLCSVCNHISYSQPYGLNYCPNCGAKMDK